MSWVNRVAAHRRYWLEAHRAYWQKNWIRRINHLGCTCKYL